MTRVAIKRALISVYDKTGLTGLAKVLAAAGVEIVSTGSTAAAIGAAGVPVTRVEDLTGFPECLDGRVKTLHPGVHAGLLADMRQASHREQLDDLGIAPFELLVSNLYPFEATVASGALAEECVEQIDIGGPAMVRAAAKNHATVAVITDPAMYEAVAEAAAAGGVTLAPRRPFAAQGHAPHPPHHAPVAPLVPPPPSAGHTPPPTGAASGRPASRSARPASSPASTPSTPFFFRMDNMAFAPSRPFAMCPAPPDARAWRNRPSTPGLLGLR